MLLVLRSVGDPAVKQVVLPLGESRSGFGRWHAFLEIDRRDASHHSAFVRLARHDGERFDRDLAQVQSQLGFTMRLVRSVAGEAFRGKDRTNIARERGRGFVRRDDRQGKYPRREHDQWQSLEIHGRIVA